MQSRAYRKLERFMERVLSQYDLTLMEWALVGVVRDYGKKGVTMTELAKVLEVDVSHITNKVNELKATKLLTKTPNPKDRREKYIQITGKGKRFVDATEKQLRIELRKWLKSVSRFSLIHYVKTLKTIADLK